MCLIRSIKRNNMYIPKSIDMTKSRFFCALYKMTALRETGSE